MYVKGDTSENTLKRKKMPWLYINWASDTMCSVVLTAALRDSSPAAGLGWPARGDGRWDGGYWCSLGLVPAWSWEMASLFTWIWVCRHTLTLVWQLVLCVGCGLLCWRKSCFLGREGHGWKSWGRKQYCRCLTSSTLCRSLHWKPPLTRLPIWWAEREWQTKGRIWLQIAVMMSRSLANSGCSKDSGISIGKSKSTWLSSTGRQG